jgi:hypothetical protein
VPNLNHLWQRFLLASSLLVGLAIGVTATVFGYSNLTSVDVHWSVFHINGVPLWTVAVVPLALTLVAGTLYHWVDGLHHFTEHMRHRHRVHELEAEVAALRVRLDQVLDMPDHSSLPARGAAKASLPPPEEEAPEPAPMEVTPAPVVSLPEEHAVPARKPSGERRKRVRLTVAPHPDGEKANGAAATPAATPAAPIAEPADSPASAKSNPGA